MIPVSRWRVALPATLAAAMVLLASCNDIQDYYLGQSDDPEASELYHLVEVSDDPQVRATAIRELSSHLLLTGGPKALIAYLTSYVEEHPNDPFGGLYLYLAGQTYLEESAADLACYYFERVVNLYPEVEVSGTSLRESALRQLVRLSHDPEQRAAYYRILINEYPDEENPGLLYYRLAENLALLGAWSEVYDAYRQILRYPALEVPGVPGAYREIEDRVEFHDSAKNWTVPTVEDLRRIITWALRNKDTQTLSRYQSKVNFFTRSWEQDFDDPNATPNWNIGELLRLTRRGLSIRAEVELDADGDEAFLWTYGWGGLRIRTWYLYFRRVHYPPDPEIHGTWEWAGVYLGERL